VRVVDDAGEETRAYGELGELVKTTRTLRPLKPLESPMVFTTRFQFDEYGRMSWIKYPDGETVRYGYDRGGLLRTARGDRPATIHYPAASEQYLEFMTYDEFGQRRVVKLGNGALTTYSYHEQNHRLAHLGTEAAGRRLQNLRYGYDLVGNVTFESNGLGAPTESRSGDTSFEFQYDSLDRLRWAKGTAAARPGVTDEFQATYAYSSIHNMTSNTQVHKVTTVTDLGSESAYPPHTNHDFSYTYDGERPHQATQIGDTFLTYDGNGNTTTECRNHADPTCSINHDQYRSYQWTEDNRLASVIDGGGRNITKFVYDAAGERVVKYGRGGASITVGQFFSVKGRTAATKHIFAGTARLASKLLPPGDFASPTLGSPLPATVSGTTATATASTGTTTSSSTTQVGGGVPNVGGCVPSEYQPQKCPILVNGEPVVPYPFQDTKVRPETYYYHPDHLGSTSWVTDQNGKVHEHVEYFPYGEVWREPKSDRDGAGVKGQRFLFSGKELDEETGLYYFGARYYDPVRVRWASVDPQIIEQSVPGVSSRSGNSEARDRDGRSSLVRARWPRALSPYSYVGWTPLAWTDPDGLAERGDVVFFNWGNKKGEVQDWPMHLAIVTRVDANGNPTHAFGAWGDSMTYHEVDLSTHNGGITKNIVGTGSMTWLNESSADDVVKTWSGRAVAKNWGENGEPGPVCVDVATAVDGLGGSVLRAAMDQDLKDNMSVYSAQAKRSGTSAPEAGKDSLYRRNQNLRQFLMNTDRFTNELNKKKK
jgi:RHS repeat-associated protein